MIATYRLQLAPGFGCDEVRALLSYFVRLGISHIYLSPVTDARGGSPHGYDVVDHNRVRDELGGPDAFFALVRSARAVGLELIVDFVPNHAAVGVRNARWQDVLAYGPHSPYALHFDIDWTPLKPELRWKVLLPFLEASYGEVLDRGGITLVYEQGGVAAAAGGSRFALSPPSYADVLDAIAPAIEEPEAQEEVRALAERYRVLPPQARSQADDLRRRLYLLSRRVDLPAALTQVRGARLHAILERQFWRLAFWQTASSEINYRRFFDVNDLVGLRVDREDVFADIHRLLARLGREPGIAGVRIDHVDGLADPGGYLRRLVALGVRRIWVEKILARGETLPADWPVEGTVGYDFLNDVLGVLTWPGGMHALDRTYRRFVRERRAYADEVHRSKRLVMESMLAADLSRLAWELDRISEVDYHTRDFSLEALREALAEIVAAFPRYRTYLPGDREEDQTVVALAAAEARRRNPHVEASVYEFIARVLRGEVDSGWREAAAAWVHRFQQYTAPVAAKGVEDTAFYRYHRLTALNEVGGDPDRFGLPAQAFHARNRFRGHRYPRTLLATATHDHKRGEDTRLRLLVLAEVPDAWQRAVGQLSRIARRHRSPAAPARTDEYLFFQTVAALWAGADLVVLTDRLVRYMHKAAREAKEHTSWLNPHPEYEQALERFVRGMMADPRLPGVVAPLAQVLARFGFANSVSQLVLKLTAPGVPDFYRGAELLDLTLVDPDNRAPVDFGRRERLLEGLEPLLERPDAEAARALLGAADERGKLYVTARLLRFRRAHPGSFDGDYRPIDGAGPRADHLIAFARVAGGEVLVVVVPRFFATLEQEGGWGETQLRLPAPLAGRTYADVLSGAVVAPGDALTPAALALPWGVLYSAAAPEDPPVTGG